MSLYTEQCLPWLIQMSATLREKPLPEHSHTIPGVAQTPPETLTAGTRVPLQRAAPRSRWVPLFNSSHTHSLWGTSSSLRLNPRFPEAESLTPRTPDKRTEWCSGVNQLELGASGEGPRTKKPLGNYTLTV